MEPWLTRHARERPQRVALEAGGESLTYAELHERAAAAVDARPGERVAIDHPPGLELAVALHGCLLAGAAALPLDPRHGAEERARRARTAGQVGDPGVALVVHTSGTTAEPKEVELTLANVHANAAGTAAALGLDPGERWLCPLPLTHVGGLMVLLRSLVHGTTAIVGVPDAAEVARRLGGGEATLVSLVPTLLARVLDAGLQNPPRLRAVMLGGGPVDPELVRRAAAAGVPVAQTYGLTEACSAVTISAPGDAETAGPPIAGVGVEIAPDGEILVSGPTVAGGGVLSTGDLGRLDERGRLIVIGRKADTIVTGGENVAPAEVEAVLLAHPAVTDAGVFGRPDPEWGEAVCAQVVTSAAVDPEELRRHCAQRLAAFKVPKRIERVAVLPRTESGKLLRRALP